MGGGGLYGCDGLVENNVFAHNSAAMGGAMAFCDGVMQSNLIIRNSADNQAGGLARCDGKILNNTFYGNTAGQNGGGIYDCRGTISNCIFWANSAGGLGPQIHVSNPSFSCIQGWTGGGNGNITEEPRFAEPDNEDFRLLAGSLCIDTGDNAAITSPGLDMDGNLRIAFGENSLTVDMGAYEYNSTRLAIREVAVLGNGSVLFTWTSQPTATYMVWSCDDLLTGTWLKAAKSPISSGGAMTSFAITAPPSRTKFYRVRIMGR